MDSKLFIDLLPEFDEYLLDIHTAASIGCEERVRDIIESSANKCIVDLQNKNGWTPLMYAVCCVNLKIALLLLEEGAQTDIKNDEGQTALTLASKCGSGDIVNLLIDSGANVNEKDLRGWTALSHAAAFGHRSIVQLLIERGALIDGVDDEVRITPLMLAAAAGHEIVVKDLLQLGTNINIETVSGDTAKSLALKNGHINVKNLIDAHLHLKKKGQAMSVRTTDLASLLKELQLTKYYHIFESHGIDLNTFWLLTDDDLKEIGIQLLGPRKKMCMAISQYQQEHCLNSSSRETVVSIDNILLENKKLYQLVDRFKSAVLHEKTLRIAADRKLSDVTQNFQKYMDSVQHTLKHANLLLERQKENYECARKILSSTIQDCHIDNSDVKCKLDVIYQSVDYMGKLIEFQHKNISSIQRSDVQDKLC